jgi:membrane protein insertase Oxa1/YidC/SpoIIIJ
MPLFISMSFMIRRLCGQPIPWIESRLSESIDPEITMQLAQGGLAWFTDLTASDSTWILPTVIGLLHLANIEFGTISARTRQGPELTGWRKNLRSILRGMSFASVPIAAQLPSGVCVYWTTSAAFSLVQNLTMQHPTIRRWCGFPDTSTEK